MSKSWEDLDRTEKMQWLRERNLCDTHIGYIFNLSGERIAQIIGRVRQGKFHKDLKRLREMLEAGCFRKEIVNELHISLNDWHGRFGLSYGDYASNRQERVKTDIARTIADLYNRGIIGSVNTGEIDKYNHNLYVKMYHYFKVEELRERVSKIVGYNIPKLEHWKKRKD